jgi:ribonucleoside-diphosphate reductase alpha chain
MPPTGTTSMVAGVSSGLEPIFAPVYKRKFRTSTSDGRGRYKENLEVDPLFKSFVEEGMDTSHFIGAYDIDPFEHMQVQATCQKYVCNSISKTINMNADYPVEKLNELLLEYGPMIKGTTLYREGCKGVEILTPVDHTKMSREEILKIASN